MGGSLPFKDGEGYTYAASFGITVNGVRANVADYAPGSAGLVFDLVGTLTVTHTTAGRNRRVSLVERPSIKLLWPAAAIGAVDPNSRCHILHMEQSYCEVGTIHFDFTEEHPLLQSGQSLTFTTPAAFVPAAPEKSAVAVAQWLQQADGPRPPFARVHSGLTQHSGLPASTITAISWH